jgi:hypothetical protein
MRKSALHFSGRENFSHASAKEDTLKTGEAIRLARLPDLEG